MILNISEPRKVYKNWRYKNTAFLILSLGTFFYLADTAFVNDLIFSITDLGYIGVFLTGIFFVSTFTVAPALVVLYSFAHIFNPFLIALAADAGAVFGDFLIYSFLKDRVFEELKPLFLKMGGSYLVKLFQTPYFAWLTPLVGATIIASPLPDEIGIGLLGISKLKSWQFLLLSFLLNLIGIFIVIALAQR